METSWKTIDQGICVLFDENVVHIQSNEALVFLLRAERKKGAFRAAADIKTAYRKANGTELPISDRSLACEIYWHYRIWKRAAEYERKHGKRKISDWFLRHMETIDCGDKKSDNNRFLWDFLALFF